MAFEKIGIGGILEFQSRQAVMGINKASRAFDGLQARTGKMRKAAGSATFALGGLGMVTAPMAVAFGAAAREYAQFDQAMAEMSSAAGVSKDALEAARTHAIKVGGATKFTATEIADSMTQLQKAGFETAAAMEISGAAASLAQAENIPLADAITNVSDTLKVFNLGGEHASRVADELAQGANISSTSVQALGRAAEYSRATMAEMGMSTAEMVGTLAVLQERGLKGTKAGRGFNAMIKSMRQPEVTKFFRGLGVELENTDGSMKKLQTLST